MLSAGLKKDPSIVESSSVNSQFYVLGVMAPDTSQANESQVMIYLFMASLSTIVSISLSLSLSRSNKWS